MDWSQYWNKLLGRTDQLTSTDVSYWERPDHSGWLMKQGTYCVDMWFGGRFGGFGGRTRQRVDIPLGDSQTVTLTLASSTLAQANFSPPGGDDTLC